MRTIRCGRRVRTEPRPLFPGYTFVSLDITRDAWRSVNGTFGVRKLVECGGMPSPVPSPLIVALMEMVEADGCVSFASQLEKGSRVQFLSGPFYGMIGSLEHLDGQGRIRVLLSLFGRETQVKARAVDVRPT